MKIKRYLPLLLCFCISQALADTPIQLRHDATARRACQRPQYRRHGECHRLGPQRGAGHRPTGRRHQAAGHHRQQRRPEIKVEPQGGSGCSTGVATAAWRPPRWSCMCRRAASLDVDVVSAPLVIDGHRRRQDRRQCRQRQGSHQRTDPLAQCRQCQRRHRTGRPCRDRRSCRPSAAISWPPRWAATPSCRRFPDAFGPRVGPGGSLR